MTRISFLLPTFNRAPLIAQAVRAITSQMAPQDELIIINDGCTDDTLAVLAAMTERFTLLNQENAGKSVALNHAMTKASGEFVWVCDDDDILSEGAVDTLLRLLEDPQVGWAFGHYTRFRDVGGELTDLGLAHWPDLSQGSVLRHTLEDAFVMQNGALVRRKLYDQVGPFDDTLLRSLDYDMFVRLALAAPAAHTTAVVFKQRKHPGARGPASVQHAADEANNVWSRWDRTIFEKQRGRLTEDLFASFFESSVSEAAKRAGLLQRAAVMARHDLFEDAFDDWASASQVLDSPLHPLEWEICRRAMAGRHGFSGALTSDSRGRFHQLMAQGGVGKSIVEALLDGLIWRLRDDNTINRPLARELIAAIEGPVGLATLLARRARSKITPNKANFDLSETRSPQLPPDCR
ncbi:MAG: glycosyltransferase family A protein [Pseudomonadota bacterium]